MVTVSAFDIQAPGRLSARMFCDYRRRNSFESAFAAIFYLGSVYVVAFSCRCVDAEQRQGLGIDGAVAACSGFVHLDFSVPLSQRAGHARIGIAQSSRGKSLQYVALFD